MTLSEQVPWGEAGQEPPIAAPSQGGQDTPIALAALIADRSRAEPPRRHDVITDPRMHRQVLIGSNLIFLLVVASVWARPRVVLFLVALQAFRTLFNVLAKAAVEIASRRAGSTRRGVRLAFAALTGANLALNIALAQIASWTLPCLLFVPFHVLVTACYAVGPRRSRLSPAFLAMPAAALLAGVPVLTVVCFVVLGLLVSGTSSVRSTILREMGGSLSAKQRELAEAHHRLQQLQDKMLEQEKLAALGVLAAGIAHEINNPMSYVTSNVEGLLRELDALRSDDQVAREYAEEILPATMDGIRRVNTIVKDLRRFARVDREGTVQFDLNEQVEAAVRLSTSETKHRCRIETDLGDVPPLVGRSQQIVQVIVNLIVNAAQATRGDGVVRIATRATEKNVLIEVKDNGVGMTPEIRSKLFQPFFTTKPVGEGTGLGLAVSHGVVKSHGGAISVQSEPGRGSTFTVRLPQRSASPLSTAALAKAEAKAA